MAGTAGITTVWSIAARKMQSRMPLSTVMIWRCVKMCGTSPGSDGAVVDVAGACIRPSVLVPLLPRAEGTQRGHARVAMSRCSIAR
jgi:hypothetical protein